MIRHRIAEIISCFFIVLFVYASVTKLIDYERFVIQIGQSPILTRWTVMISWFIPAIELVIAILLGYQNTRLLGLHCALSLMVMFTSYIILATRFSDFVPCSCGGVIENLTWSQHLIFNGVFVVLGIIGVLIESSSRKMTYE